MTAMLLEERADGVLRLTLNRPEARNALSIELMNALLEALGRAAKEPGTRVVVIAGLPSTICMLDRGRPARKAGQRPAVLKLDHCRPIAYMTAFAA